MNDFENRLERGLQAERRVFGQLEAEGHDVVRNGTEHTHPNFVSRLRDNDTEAAKFIRYAPDGAYRTNEGQVIHFDVKAANAIEKDAWNVYRAHEAAGCRVKLYIEFGGKSYSQWLSDVRFLDSHSYVERFQEVRRFPIDEQGWICPRQKPGFRPDGKMSGTPYKYLDFDSLTETQHHV